MQLVTHFSLDMNLFSYGVIYQKKNDKASEATQREASQGSKETE